MWLWEHDGCWAALNSCTLVTAYYFTAQDSLYWSLHELSHPIWTVISALKEPASVYSVILGRYPWQLADTLCPSKDMKSMMGRVSWVLLGLAECSFVMESMVQCRQCHGQWGCWDHLHLGGRGLATKWAWAFKIKCSFLFIAWCHRLGQLCHPCLL